MKETIEKQTVNYAEKTLPELLTLAMTGDMNAAGEIVARQEQATKEIEQLKIKANSKTRAPRAEKTPKELAQDNAYYRTSLLAKQFGLESVNMQTLTLASAFLDQGLAQGNLRQAYNRVQQVLRAQAITEEIFPAWILTAAQEIPVLDENKKLEDPEEAEKVNKIEAVVKKYMDTPETLPPPPEEIIIDTAPAAQAPAAQANKKKGGKK